MTPAAQSILSENASLSARRTPFHVLAVGKCKAVQPLLERIVNAGPAMELHTCLPDGAGWCAPHGQVLDLIFVDADSPAYPAAGICKAFKRNLETRTVPLIVVSSSPKACEKAVQQGADDFATPHTLPVLLLRRIEALVHIRQARQLLHYEDEGSHEPQFPPLEWDDRVPSKVDPPPRVQFGGESLACTPAVVLFADIRGYTRMCECVGPRQVAILLTEYYTLISQVTLEHRGVVFNAAGDCVMVGFDLSQTPSEVANHALRAAQMMLGRFASLAASWLTRFHVAVGLGVGLNAGEVASTPIGFPLFPQYTLIGDTVNVAARLCQRARSGEIVLSSSFKQFLGDNGKVLSIAPLSHVTVRGRNEPIDIFCLPLDPPRSDLLEIESIAIAKLERRRLAYDGARELRNARSIL